MKLVAVTLSVGFAILTAMNGTAQEQKDPFKKEQAGKTENTAQPQQLAKVLLVSTEMRMIEMPRLAADELFKEQGGLAKTFVINEKTLGAVNDLVIQDKAKVVSQSKVITTSGANCENKSMHEFTYPTAYDISGGQTTNSMQALPDSRSNATNSVKVLPGILIPTGFETRDCGTIFTITPCMGPDNKVIDIVLLFQRVRLSACPNKVGIRLSG